MRSQLLIGEVIAFENQNPSPQSSPRLAGRGGSQRRVLVDRVANHLENYCQTLRDPAQGDLRANFEDKFDADILPQLQ
jgi:hypothetical protein